MGQVIQIANFRRRRKSSFPAMFGPTGVALEIHNLQIQVKNLDQMVRHLSTVQEREQCVVRAMEMKFRIVELRKQL